VRAGTVPAVIVKVQDDVCVGHGRCYVLAPDVFGADDFGHCVVLVGEIAEGDALGEQAHLGAANCPEQAIVIDTAPVPGAR
jgi:ferredoxin